MPTPILYSAAISDREEECKQEKRKGNKKAIIKYRWTGSERADRVLSEWVSTLLRWGHMGGG